METREFDEFVVSLKMAEKGGHSGKLGGTFWTILEVPNRFRTGLCLDFGGVFLIGLV